jgi:hypothetical protein
MALKGINGTYAAISRNLKLYVWGKNTSNLIKNNK